MTIDNIGNVGIGNTNPVNGKLVVSRGGGIPDLEISTNTSADTLEKALEEAHRLVNEFVKVTVKGEN